jgi:arylsulfatase A-like enzyme
MKFLFALPLLLLAQDPAPKAARSVHLWWTAPEGTDFTNEARVETSTPGSYFMACGWNTGYFGIQELGNKDKIVLFSVWDPTKGDDAKAVPLEKRVEILYSDPDVKVGRFGGEGTGGNAKYKCDWALGERCRFLVRVQVEDQKTSYTGFFKRDADKEWKKLVTFRVTTGGQSLKGYYSFVEDFRRDGKSPNERRAAVYGPGWVKSTKGEWTPVVKASFGADATKLDNIDAALSGAGFLLATGGATTMSTKLKSSLTLPDAKRTPPDDLPN